MSAALLNKYKDFSAMNSFRTKTANFRTCDVNMVVLLLL